MALIVHKYGGTSMGSPQRIRNVAHRVAKWRKAGHQMVVVVSAMSGETNRLLALAKEVSPHPDPRELDVVATTGEQVSIGLLAMALKDLGVDAVSLTGWQVGVFTDNDTSPGEIFDGSCTDSEISHEYETCRWNYEDEGEVEEACEAWNDDSDDDRPRRRRGRKPLPPDVDLFELCSEAPVGPARDLKSEFRQDGDR